MDPEQTLHFILEQQQRLGSYMERLDGYVERIARNQLELVETQSRQAEGLSQLTVIVHGLAEGLNRLSEDHRSLAERTDQRFQELIEAQRHTDESLNALIKIVDDLIRRDGRRA